MAIRKELLIVNTAKKITPNKNMSFPIHAMPDGCQMLLKAYDEADNFDPALLATAMLAVFATIGGNRYLVRYKNTHKERLVLWWVLVAIPGTKKSHILNAAVAPLAEHDRRKALQFARDLEDYEARKMQAEMSKTPFTEKKPENLDRYIYKSFTLEALLTYLSKSHNGVLCLYDEFAAHLENSNRYNKGKDEAYWLSMHNGGGMQKDTKTGGTEDIVSTCVNQCGAIQPDCLELMGIGSRNNGTAQRYMFAFSDREMEDDEEDKEVPNELLQEYTNAVDRILAIPYNIDENNKPVPNEMQLSYEARQIYRSWKSSTIARAKRETSQLAKGIYSKMQGYCLRLAGILQILHYAYNEAGVDAINADVMSKATSLAEYYLSTFFRAHNDTQEKDPATLLMGERAEAYAALPETFTKAQALEILSRLHGGWGEKRVSRFLSEERLFNNFKHGNYEKR